MCFFSVHSLSRLGFSGCSGVKAALWIAGCEFGLHCSSVHVSVVMLSASFAVTLLKYITLLKYPTFPFIAFFSDVVQHEHSD